MKKAPHSRRKPVVEEIEPRILYSADFSPGLLTAAPLSLDAEQRTLDAGGEFAAHNTQSTPQQQVSRHEVVFVDTATPDYQKLIEDIKAQSGADRQLDVVLLDPNADGIKQISATLAGMQDVSAVHLIGHGADGEIELGGATLNFDSLVKNAAQIKGWGQALAADADLLIYGCDVAQHADGKALIDALSRLTGADAAASDDVTGAAAKGGDWTLEYSTGHIETALAVSAQEQRDYSGVLQGTAAGTETRANTTTGATQSTNANPQRAVAMDAQGNYVVVWNSAGQDGSGDGVYGQRFNSAGAAQGVEFRVNTTTTGNQNQSSVAMDANGNFVVTWNSPDTDGTGVYARRFNAAGTALGSEFRVNSTIALNQSTNTVTMNASGSFVVAWTSDGQDGSGVGVYAQRYSAAGATQGSEFRVNVTTAGNQYLDSVALDAAGNFLITWASNGQDGSADGVYSRRFNSSGVAQTAGDVRVNTTTIGDQNWSSSAMDTSGDYIVTWTGAGQDGSGDGIYGQRFNSAGVAQGVEFRVNSTTAGDQRYSNVAMDSNGNFVVTWSSFGQDVASTWSVYKQEYNADGTTNGGEVRVNTTTSGDQLNSSVAMNASRDFAIAWSGNGTGDGAGVFVQRYAAALVVDTANDTSDGNTSSISALLGNKGADGKVSLREAILAANNTANVGGADVIKFNIAGAGSHLITLASALPDITQAVIIDGTSQSGYAGTPLIELNGTGVGGSASGLHSGLRLVAGSSGSTIKGLAINRFGDDGILINGSSNNVITANFLGTNAAGTAGLGNLVGVAITGAATNNQIGGTTAAERNIISANTVDGVQIQQAGTSGNIVQGNYIGLDVTGAADLGNINQGVAIFNNASNNTIGGTAAGTANVISGNNGEGVRLDSGASGNSVLGNRIGTNAAGTAGIGNSTRGVAILNGATGNTIGGTVAGAGNTIAYNTQDGVAVTSATSTGNRILANAIFSNGGLGIDLNDDAVTANETGDGDTGSNNLQNFPVLSGSVTTGSQITIAGTLNSHASRNYRIEFFASSAADPSGNGEGQQYLGFTNVTTDGSGNWTFSSTLVVAVANGQYVSATATDLTTNDTSEFGNALQVINHAPVLSGSNNLTTINEDPSSNAGTLVSSLLAGKVSDSDPNALSGIAVTGVVNTNGTWEYSTNGGTVWTAFGAPAANNARLLAADANTYVRFVPSANWNGTLSNGITFRAWDQTSGTAGSTASTTTNGGSSAYSTVLASASVTVSSVNDAPAGTNKTVTTPEDTAYTFAAADFGLTDTSDNPANTLLAVKIATLPGAGTLRNNLVAVTAGQFVSLTDINSGKLVFTPLSNASGTGYATFTFQVQDSGGTANSGVDLDPTANTMTINVTSVNDAPRGTNNTVTTLEDTAYAFGAIDFGFSDTNDTPANTLAAVKITTLPGAGTLRDNGSAVTLGQFVSLADITGGLLTFTPAANANGMGYASFTFQVQDNGGIASGGVDLDPTPRTMAINVTAVNDAPVLSGADDLSTISQNQFSNGGTLVSAVLSGHVSDVDAGAATGIAVTAVDNTNGAWEYSTNGGTIWTAFGAPTASSARLLAADASTYVRFVPTLNFSGTVGSGITFRAWDQTSGTAGSTANTTPNGGSTAFSAATASAGITVNVVGVPTASNDAYSLNEDGTLTVGWWDTDWTKRRALTLSGNTFVGAQNLTDFPVLVTLNSGNFDYAAAKADGSDLRFFDASGAALAYEIEDWNASGNSYVWVKVPQVNTTGIQQVQMYYGNLAAADGQDAAAVWSGNGFQAVYHLSESGPAIGDATGNGFDGTATNGPTSTAGEIGGALNFDGVSQYVNLGTSLPLINTANAVTLSAWVNSSTLSGDETILAISRDNGGVPTGSSRAQIILTGTNVQVVARSTSDDTDVATVATTDAPFTGQAGVWHYVTGVIDYAANSIKIYIDGVQDMSTSGTPSFTNPATPIFDSEDAAVGANDDGGSAYFDGGIDEARISNVGRSAAWAKAEYLTMTDAFVSVGSAQSAPAIGGVLTNDTDPGSVDFSASLVGGPTHAAAFTLNPDGTFTYTPVANFAGTDTFTYTAVDSFNTSNTATVTITVNPVNDAPQGASGGVTAAEDTPYTFGTVDFGFGDPDDTPANSLLAVKITTLPGAGSLTANGVAVTTGQFVTLADIGGGNLVFTPAANANGGSYASFTFQVQDDGGTANGGADLDLTPRTMTIDVAAVNDAPLLSGSSNLTAIDEDATGNAGTLVSALIAGQVTDIDAAPLTGIAVIAVDNSNGDWQYSTNGGTSWASIGSPSTGAALLLNADLSTSVRFVPNADWNGTVSNGITFRAWDQTSGAAGSTADTSTNGGTSAFSTLTASASITVNPVNDAPAGANHIVTTLEDTAYTFAAIDFGFSDAAADSPADTLLAVKITSVPGAGTLTDNGAAVTAGQFVSLSDISTGKLVFTPGANAHAVSYATFTFQVQDDGGVANGGIDLDPTPRTMTVRVTSVNDAPQGTSNTVTTLEDTAYAFAAADFDLGFSDAGDTPANTLLAVRITTVPAAGMLTDNGVAVSAGQFVSLTDINAGLLIYTPGANANGTSYANFSFQVQDNGGITNGGVDTDTTPRTMTVDVVPVSDAPQGTDNTVTTPENTAYTFGAVDFGFNDAGDSPANTFTAVEITTLPGAGSLTNNGAAVTAGQFVALADISGGLLVFTPAASGSGAGYASFTFQVQDDGGTANGGADTDTTPRTMTVDVTGINDAPVLGGSNNLAAINEDPVADIGTPVSALIAGQVSDADSGAVSGIAVTAVDNTNGTWEYSTDSGTVWTAFGAPTSAAARLLASDAATYVRFVPNANWNGTVSNGIAFQAWDQSSGVAGSTADASVNGGTTAFSTATASASITVNSVNDTPSGVSNTVTTPENTAYAFGSVDFGFSDLNDTPADTFIAVEITTLPGAGSLTNNAVAVTAGQFVTLADIIAGNLVFTPVAGANGAGYASFTFQVQDDGGTANGGVDVDATPRTMTINVTTVNDAPQGTSNTVTTLEDTAHVFGMLDFGFGDPGDSPANALAAVQITTLPGAGSLTDNGAAVSAGQFVALADINGGQLVFTPAADANGAGYASFTFRVQDNGGVAGGGVDLDPIARTMTVDVNAVNDAPVLGNDTLTIMQGGAVVLSGANLSAADIDSAAGALLFTVSNVADGQFELVAAPGVAVTTFTQGAVAAGQVRFVHDGSSTAPGFDLMVSDGVLTAGPSAASIVFSVPAAAVAGAGPVVIVAPPPPPPAPVFTNPAAEPAAPAEPTTESSPAAAAGEPQVVFSPGRLVVAESVGVEVPAPQHGLARFVRLEPSSARTGANPAPSIQVAEMTLLIQGSEPTYMEFGPSTLPNWSAHSAFPDEGHGSERDQIKVIMESVEMGGLALSVGVVWWASRVGGLIGSLLASMPAWRHLDPLPIMSREEDEEEGDQLQDADADADELAVAMVLEGSQPQRAGL